jgi:hypothetical protein
MIADKEQAFKLSNGKRQGHPDIKLILPADSINLPLKGNNLPYQFLFFHYAILP